MSTPGSPSFSPSSGPLSVSVNIPDAVRVFYRSLSRHLISRNTYQLHQLYEVEFPKIADRYYSEQAWPTAEQIENAERQEIGAGLEFSPYTPILYRELYFRHIYARLTPDVDDRLDSYQCYIDLLTVIIQMNNDALVAAVRQDSKLTDKQKKQQQQQQGGIRGSSTDHSVFELPVNWMWDILDEFVDEFQSFHSYRHRRHQQTEEEKQILSENPHAWNAHTVLRYLYALLNKAGFKQHSHDSANAAGGSTSAHDSEGSTVDDSSDGDSVLVAQFFRRFGYFAMISLVRVHVLLCDYSSALDVSQASPSYKKYRLLHTSVPACYVTLSYHLGFAYLLLHRYYEANRVFYSFAQNQNKLKSKSKQTTSGSSSSSSSSTSGTSASITKRIDMLQGLFAIASVITMSSLSANNSNSNANTVNPSLTDSFDGGNDVVLNELKDKIGSERFTRLQRFDIPLFEEIFLSCAPKCVLVSATASYADGEDAVNTTTLSTTSTSSSGAVNIHVNTPQEQRRQQWYYFSQDIIQRASLQPCLEYLSLFSSLSLNKLSSFLQLNEDDTIATLLLCCEKTQGATLSGQQQQQQQQPQNELELSLDADRVEVRKEQGGRRYGEFFSKQILKLRQLQQELHSSSHHSHP